MGTKHIDAEEVHKVATQLLLGASASLDIAANIGFAFTHVYSQLRTEDLLAISDSRLSLRCILGLPIDHQGEYASKYLEALRDPDFAIYRVSQPWNLRLVDQWQGEHFIIVDRSIAFVSRPAPRTSAWALTLTDRRKEVQSLIDRFESTWKRALELDLLYRDDAFVEEPRKSQILIVSQGQWDRLIQVLAQKPELMRAMAPRDFEELVAELLSREGLQVVLTPRSRDGGRDILACLETPIGEHLYLVECKRYAANRPVGVELVRQLYGIVEIERATAGLLVTTSTFTSGAYDLQRTIGHRLGLRDYDDLVNWLKNVKAV
jgi:hypothetical protein